MIELTVMEKARAALVLLVGGLVLGGLVWGVLTWRESLIEQGRQESNAAHAVIKATADKAAARELESANTRAREASAKLVETTRDYERIQTTERQQYAESLQFERSRAIAGVSGLRCPAASRNPSDSVGKASDSTATATLGGETGTVLVPGAADAVLRIAADSAETVRDYNAVVRLYNAARDVCNAP